MPAVGRKGRGIKRVHEAPGGRAVDVIGGASSPRRPMRRHRPGRKTRKEQADQSASRPALVGLDMGIEPVGGHRRPSVSHQNFTCGACSSSLALLDADVEEILRREVRACGASRTAPELRFPIVLFTALLKNGRAAAILFSMSERSRCSCWKFWLALRSG